MVVGFSHTAVADAVCRRLYAVSRRRLAVIGADERSQRRTAAFLAAARSLRLPQPAVYHVAAPAKSDGGRSGLRALLAQAPDIDGVFCRFYFLAWAC